MVAFAQGPRGADHTAALARENAGDLRPDTAARPRHYYRLAIQLSQIILRSKKRPKCVQECREGTEFLASYWIKQHDCLALHHCFAVLVKAVGLDRGHPFFRLDSLDLGHRLDRIADLDRPQKAQALAEVDHAATRGKLCAKG